MTDNEHNPDPNVNAARIVYESTAAGELPADLEAAWAACPQASKALMNAA